jgi:hypothetical protein
VEFRLIQANKADFTGEHFTLNETGKYLTAESAGAATPALGPGAAGYLLGQADSSSMNLGAIKRFIVHDRYDTTLRAEAINALNHPVFSAPNASPASNTFGSITGFGNSARVLQFAVEVHF